MWGTNTGVS
jgi:7-dehydrocholesterol reductase